MATPRTVVTTVVLVVGLVVGAVEACTPSQQQGERTPRSQQFSQQSATAPFVGDSTNDSSLYQYARDNTYRLITTYGSSLFDSAGTRGALDLCIEQGSAGIPYSDLGDGFWRGVGCVIRSGPTHPQFPYLARGLSYVLVGKVGSSWQAGILGLFGRQNVRLFVSVPDVATPLVADAKMFTRGGRIYACYTCDRKACCPTNLAGMSNPTQAQSDVDTIAASW